MCLVLSRSIISALHAKRRGSDRGKKGGHYETVWSTWAKKIDDDAAADDDIQGSGSTCLAGEVPCLGALAHENENRISGLAWVAWVACRFYCREPLA